MSAFTTVIVRISRTNTKSLTVGKKVLYEVRCLKSTEDMILALAGQFKQLSLEPEKFRWLNGIRTHDLCDAGAASNQLSYDVTQLRAGQYVGLMFSRERNVVWKKCYMKCGVWNQLKTWSSHLLDNLSNCLLNLKTGKHDPNILTCSQLCDFIAQLVRALHRHRRGRGFESRWVTWIFQVQETIA